MGAFEGLVGELEYPMFIVTARAGRRAARLPRRLHDAGEHRPAALHRLPLAHQPHLPARQDAPALGVHAVPADADDLAQLFGGETADETDKFARTPWREGPEGVPILERCSNWFVGRVVARWTPATTTRSCSNRSPPRHRGGRIHVPPRQADRARARGVSVGWMTWANPRFIGLPYGRRAMRELWTQARAGDKAARAHLIERHMPLARSLAVQYRHAREPFEDLCQVANLGLVKAVDRYDPDRGIAFTSYAVPTILGELKRHFRDRTSSIHFTRSVQESIARVNKATETLRQQLGRFPTAGEVAEHCGMNVEDVTEALLADDASRHVLARRARASARTATSPTCSAARTPGSAASRTRSGSRSSPAELTPREREILRLRFVEDLVQREIAERVGLSQMHVSRVLRQALEHLAHAA